jgi:hypothetical protein
MARLNEILVGRFNRGLQKIFGIKGDAPVATLAPEIMPVHLLTTGVESRYLEGWNRFAAVGVLAASAGNVGGIRFRNDITSNAVAVFEKLAFSIGVTGQVNMLLGVQNSNLAGTTLGSNRLDSRGNQNSVIIQSMQNNAAAIAGANIFAVTIQGNTTYDLIAYENQEITVLPGDALTIVANTPNVLLEVSAFWRERFLEESERS